MTDASFFPFGRLLKKELEIREFWNISYSLLFLSLVFQGTKFPYSQKKHGETSLKNSLLFIINQAFLNSISRFWCLNLFSPPICRPNRLKNIQIVPSAATDFGQQKIPRSLNFWGFPLGAGAGMMRRPPGYLSFGKPPCGSRKIFGRSSAFPWFFDRCGTRGAPSSVTGSGTPRVPTSSARRSHNPKYNNLNQAP